MIKKIVFKGCEAYRLESETVSVVVIPSLGGKVASFYHKQKEFELLFQNKEEIYREPKIYDNFSLFDAAGFDDCFPTIDACTMEYAGRIVPLPDHGEIWSAEFDSEIIGEQIHLSYKSLILPYKYTKIIFLQDDQLCIEYAITNMGKEAIPSIWTMHCLVNCEEDMQILFPNGTAKVLNVQNSKYLGEAGSVHSFPITRDINGNTYRLDRVLPASANHTEKYYVNGEVIEGRCGIYYPSKDITYLVEYDANKLPYLGFWVTEGGFRGDYNCALEPSNGYYDRIDIAEKNNRIYRLQPGETLEFGIRLRLAN